MQGTRDFVLEYLSSLHRLYETKLAANEENILPDSTLTEACSAKRPAISHSGAKVHTSLDQLFAGQTFIIDSIIYREQNLCKWTADDMEEDEDEEEHVVLRHVSDQSVTPQFLEAVRRTTEDWLVRLIPIACRSCHEGWMCNLV